MAPISSRALFPLPHLMNCPRSMASYDASIICRSIALLGSTISPPGSTSRLHHMTKSNIQLLLTSNSRPGDLLLALVGGTMIKGLLANQHFDGRQSCNAAAKTFSRKYPRTRQSTNLSAHASSHSSPNTSSHASTLAPIMKYSQSKSTQTYRR